LPLPAFSAREWRKLWKTSWNARGSATLFSIAGLPRDWIAPAKTGLDRDQFDFICDHLMVHDAATGKLAGTYRM
jgi:hypothetical protein